MRKEKVYIVLSHKRSLKHNSKSEWEITETVEFINQLRDKHYRTAGVVGDYLERKVLYGQSVGMVDYEQFDTYVRSKYKAQMEQLDKVYGDQQIKIPELELSEEMDLVTDEFGNVRPKTVFDAV